MLVPHIEALTLPIEVERATPDTHVVWIDTSKYHTFRCDFLPYDNHTLGDFCCFELDFDNTQLFGMETVRFLYVKDKALETLYKYVSDKKFMPNLELYIYFLAKAKLAKIIKIEATLVKMAQSFFE